MHVSGVSCFFVCKCTCVCLHAYKHECMYACMRMCVFACVCGSMCSNHEHGMFQDQDGRKERRQIIERVYATADRLPKNATFMAGYPA